MNSVMLRKVNAREALLKEYAYTNAKNYFILNSLPPGKFINIIARLGDRKINLYCDVDELLSRCSANSHALPVKLIDDDLLIKVAKNYFSEHKISMPVSLEPITQFLIDGIADTANLFGPFISMDPTSGFIWAELTSINIPELIEHKNKCDWSQLMLSMNIILGYTEISHKELISLKAGDLLMLHVPINVGILGRVFTVDLKLEGENMITESMEEYTTDLADDCVNLVEANNLSLDKLELKVIFCLEEKIMTLAQLQNMHVNQRLPLHNEKNDITVSLRVGKHIIATGELVRVDDQLAVEIHNINGAI